MPLDMHEQCVIEQIRPFDCKEWRHLPSNIAM